MKTINVKDNGTNRTANKRVILDLCGGTGAWSEEYRKEGYISHVITLPKYDITATCECELLTNDGRWVKGLAFGTKKEIDGSCASDAELMVAFEDIYGIFAAPPCTMFSRARTTAKTPRDFEGAMQVVKACLNVIWETEINSPFTLAFWALENPAGHLARFLGRPAFKFHPYDFGDPHSKQTYIWGRFNIPKKKPVKLTEKQLEQSRNNTRPLPPIPAGYERDGIMKSVQIRRSITPQGFAKAFFAANNTQYIGKLHGQKVYVSSKIPKK